MSDEYTAQKRSTPYWLIALIVLVFMTIWNASALVPVFRQGELFGPDDFLRLSQIRAWMAGQDWFDLTAYQMVPPTGGDVHWSRIVDVPVAGLIMFFDLFTDARTAEYLAAIIWPFSLMVLTILVWVRICKAVLPASSWTLPVLFGLFSIPSLSQFAAGRLDHHNLQILLFALMVYGLVSRKTVWGHVITGMAIAFSVAIGIDTLLILLVVLAIIGFEWALGSDLNGRGMTSTGLSLGTTSIILYLVFVPPARYFDVVCDANGLFFLTAFLAVAIAFVLLGKLGSHVAYGLGRKQLFVRLFLGAVAALVTGSGLFVLFPACAAGPVAGLDPQLVARWLSEVEEARPLWSVLEQYPYHWFATVGYLIMINLAGLYIVLLPKYRNRVWISLYALMLSCSLAAVLQIRLVRTGIFITIPFCVVIAHVSWLWLRQKYSTEPILRYGFQSTVMAVLLSITWYVVGAVLLPAAQDRNPEPAIADLTAYSRQATEERRETRRCQQYDDFEFARSLPMGIMVSDLSNSMAAMVHTQLTVLSGPYHRNGEAILAVLDFLKTDEEKAQEVVKRYKLDFAGICLPHLLNHASEYPDGSVAAKLLAGNAPSWMIQVSPAKDRFRIFRLDVNR